MENCREKRQFDIVNYGKHFSSCHKDLDLDKLLVTNEKGVKYAVLDIYKSVYRCGYNKCAQLFFGIIENCKADFIKKIKGHWSNSSKGKKSHKEETNKECVFDNLVEYYTFVQNSVTRTHLCKIQLLEHICAKFSY